MVFKEIEQNKIKTTVEFLIKIPTFQNWGQRALERFSYNCKIRSFIRGQTVYQKGEAPSFVYFVKNGEFCVHLKRNDVTLMQI